MQTALLLIVNVWLYMVGMALITIFTISLSGGFSIAPGQGFWVAAAGTSDAALDFTAAMRTTTGTGDFDSRTTATYLQCRIKALQW